MPLRQRLPNYRLYNLYSGFTQLYTLQIFGADAVLNQAAPRLLKNEPKPTSEKSNVEGELSERLKLLPCWSFLQGDTPFVRTFELTGWTSEVDPTIAHNKLRLFVPDPGRTSLYAKICIYCNGVRNGTLQYLPTACPDLSRLLANISKPICV